MYCTLKGFHSHADLHSLMYGLTPLPILLDLSDSSFISRLLICDSAEQICPQVATCHNFPLRIDKELISFIKKGDSGLL